MRSKAPHLVVAVAAVAVLVFALRSSAQSGYRVAAIFQSAKGMVPGQLVKIAGAKVGTVTGLSIRPGPTARVEMSIDKKFGPFHANATCEIRPEGPISEYFIDCDPGSGALERTVDGTPTVPIAHTSDPVTLQDVINIFSLPTDERISSLIGELGIATSARGAQLNQILARANPALAQAQRVLGIVDGQTQRLQDAVTQTDTVLTRLAGGDRQLRSFVDHAAAVTATTASRSSQLANAIHELPPMLTAITSATGPVNQTITSLTPVLRDLHTAAPNLVRFNRVVPAFERAASPALSALKAPAAAATRALPRIEPVIQRLNTFATVGGPTVDYLTRVLNSIRDTGGIEGLMRLMYTLASAGASYDGVSHEITLLAQVNAQCFTAQTSPGCSHNYYAAGQGTVPNNDPVAGPQLNDWRPTASTASGATHQAAEVPPVGHASLSRAQLRSILGYLLR